MAMLTTRLLVGVACVVVQSDARKAVAALILPLGLIPGGFRSLGNLCGVVAPVFSPLQPPCSIDTGCLPGNGMMGEAGVGHAGVLACDTERKEASCCLVSD